MLFFKGRFTRLCLALSQTLARVVARHEPPEPPGREVWLKEAKNVDGLWDRVTSPLWAVHLAHHLGRSPELMMDAGTKLLARTLEGYTDTLPTVLDFGTVEPEERPVETYFAWKEQPLDDLENGQQTYEAAALEQVSVIQARTESGPESSPYRG